MYLNTSIGVLGGSKGGFVREGGGQAVVVTTLLFVLNFCIKSCIVSPSGCANCSNFLLRLTVTYKKKKNAKLNNLIKHINKNK